MDMHILARENAGLDTIARRARLHKAESGCDGFVHHIAKLTRRFDLTLAGRSDRLDRKQLAAHFGPGQTGHCTDLVFLLTDAVAIFPHTRKVGEIVRRYRDALIFLLENSAQRLALQSGNLALQRTHAGFAGVIADKVAQGLFGQRELGLGQAMRLALLVDQVPLGDLDLFILGIAFEADDLHPVEQRLRQVHAVRGGHEHHIRKIDVDLQIVIVELSVLFGIEHFEQRRSGVAAEILAQLVDLIQQEQRVHRARLLEVGDHLARQAADIGAPMTADFSLVAYAAKGLAHEFASASLGDGAPQRSLADTRRTDETQDRSLQLVGARLNREIFDDPVLHLFQRIVIIIEHLLRLRDILLEARFLAPWQAEQRVEIVAHDRSLGAHRLHALQLLQLGLCLRLGFLGKLQLLDLRGQLGDLVAFLAVLRTQLPLDRLQLFVQIIFALRLLHLALHAATDFFLDLQHAEFTLHEGKRHLQPLGRVRLDQQRLLVGNLDVDICRNRIGQRRGILDLAQLHRGFRRKLAVELGIIFELVEHRAHQRIDFLAFHGRLFGKANLDRAISVALFHRFQRHPLLALDEHTYRAVGQLQKLHDGGSDAHFVQIFSARIVLRRIKLGDEDDFLVLLHRLLQRDDGFVAADEQRHDHAGKNNDVAQRQQRQRLSHKYSNTPRTPTRRYP